MLREWIRTFAEFPFASFLFGAFVLAMTILTSFAVETFLTKIASIIRTIKTVHVEHEQAGALADDDLRGTETTK